MKRSVEKKGLSPVIASVFMVLLVLVLASIIFLWARGFIGEQIEKFGAPIEETCSNVKFDAAKYGISELEIVNTGDVDIRKMEIKMTKGGDTVSEAFDISIDAGKSARDYVTFEVNGETPEKIVVYPVLLGTVPGSASNNIFTCLDEGVVL